MRSCVPISFILSLFAVITHGCVSEDLDVCKDDTVKFRIKALWDSNIIKPEGIRVIMYPTDGKSYFIDNFPPEGGILEVKPGTYNVIVHNNDYSKISMRNPKDQNAYEAYTSKLNVGSFKIPFEDEDVVEQPDQFWIAYVEAHNLNDNHVITVKPQQIVKHYIFKLINIVGTENIRAVRASITGMMGTLLMKPTANSTHVSTLYTTKATIKDGITFDFYSFGVIDYLATYAVARKHILVVEITNGSEIKRYEFEVTDMLNEIKSGGEIDLSRQIEIPPGSGSDSGGGFEAGTNEWDKVIVPLE